MEQLEIYKLAPERLEDYLYFFENVAHTDNKEWDRCYCLHYCSAHNADMDFSHAEKRRECAIQYVNEGILQGYLAYSNGQVVGWCNANDRDDCLYCDGWQSMVGSETGKAGVEPDADGGKTKSIFCFTVAPAMRGKHVATALLERVIQDAKEEGYTCLEAYPNKGECDMFYAYVGPLELYQKLSFEQVGEIGEQFIVRKQLKRKDKTC